jgi:hypothetical protein
MAVDPDGRPVLMCVKPGVPSATTLTLAMYRFTTAGAFDTSYSGDGKTSWVIPNAATSDSWTLHFDSSAKPWVGVGGPSPTDQLRLYTLDSAGEPDAGFDGDGLATITLPYDVDLSGLWRGGNRLFVTNFVNATNVGIIAVAV